MGDNPGNMKGTILMSGTYQITGIQLAHPTGVPGAPAVGPNAQLLRGMDELVQYQVGFGAQQVGANDPPRPGGGLAFSCLSIVF